MAPDRRPHRARCDVCGTVLESLHPWDAVTCSCGRLSLSGGPQRRLFSWQADPGASWTDLSDEDPASAGDGHDGPPDGASSEDDGASSGDDGPGPSAAGDDLGQPVE